MIIIIIVIYNNNNDDNDNDNDNNKGINLYGIKLQHCWFGCVWNKSYLYCVRNQESQLLIIKF